MPFKKMVAWTILTIGIARARLKIGMMNLGYNIRRWFRSSRRRQRLLERTESIRRLCGVENTGEVGWTTWAAPARCRLFCFMMAADSLATLVHGE